MLSAKRSLSMLFIFPSARALIVTVVPFSRWPPRRSRRVRCSARLGRLSMPRLILGVGVSVADLIFSDSLQSSPQKAACGVPKCGKRQSLAIPFDLEDVRNLLVVAINGANPEVCAVGCDDVLNLTPRLSAADPTANERMLLGALLF